MCLPEYGLGFIFVFCFFVLFYICCYIWLLLSSLCYSYFLGTEVDWLSCVSAHWRKAGSHKRLDLLFLWCSEGSIGLLRVQFNFLWSIRALLHSLWKKFLGGNYFFWMIGLTSLFHNCIYIKGGRLLEEAGDFEVFLFGHLFASFTISVEYSWLMVVEFVLGLLNHGAFPVTAWEEHVMRLDNWKFSLYWKLNWLHLLHWLNGRIWGSNSNWKVGAVSISHYWVAVVSWAIRFFVVIGVFLLGFFNNFIGSFVEKIFASEASSLRLNVETEVMWINFVVTFAEDVFNFFVMETLLILFARVKVENSTVFIAWLSIAHFIVKVNWGKTFWL